MHGMIHTVILEQAQRLLGVTFFGCSHLRQTSAGDNLCCSLRPNYSQNPAFIFVLRYSKVPSPCTAEHVPPGVDVLVRVSLFYYCISVMRVIGHA
jgi:hypothetical protein